MRGRKEGRKEEREKEITKMFKKEKERKGVKEIWLPFPEANGRKKEGE